MSNSKKEEMDSDYLHFYQTFKFEEESSNPVVAAKSKRMQLILNHYQSIIQGNEENATSYLLKNDLDEYARIVDNKNGLNNYAKYISAISKLTQNPVNDCKKWTCSLNESVTKILEMDDPVESAHTDNIKQFFLQFKKNAANLPQRNVSTNTCNGSAANSNITSTNFKKPVSNSSLEVPAANKTGKSNFQFGQVKHFKPTEQNDKTNPKESVSNFRTASVELSIQNQKKFGNRSSDTTQVPEQGAVKRSLGGRTRTVYSKFVPPIKNNESEQNSQNSADTETVEDERLKGLDPKLIELIKNEIMDNGNPISWEDIAGLQFAKTTIQEIVVWPLLRPDIFTGLRRPPKGILLFGPPGTGKTLIGKCIASQSKSTFFSISASSLTSKWIGDSEKLVRTLFAVARCHQPSVIFIDEIDSLLSQRSETEHESSRRIKTEFLVQLDGATTHEDDRILVIGATNRPQELDEAARRRLVKRLYIPLPEYEARCQIVTRLMKTEKNNLTDDDVRKISELTDGYSGADMKNLCQEAALGPIRSIDFSQIDSIESHEVRAVTLSDFEAALKHVRSSVSPSDLNQYLEWDKIYGSSGN